MAMRKPLKQRSKKQNIEIILLLIFFVGLLFAVRFFLMSGDSKSTSDNQTFASAANWPGELPAAPEFPYASAVLVDDVESAASSMEEVPNPCGDLSVPTWITKIDGVYFIVDCYHNEVIYNDNLEDPLWQWNVMTSEMSMGHTLAGDGTVYLVDDTENNRIMVFEKSDGKFVFSQEFAGIGNRPHYIIYDEESRIFYAWSSMSGEMYLFSRPIEDSSRVYLMGIKQIPSLDGVYVRSFTIIDDDIYFVSGNSEILRADLETFEIKESYPVPESMAGMIQLTYIEGYYYITISTDITGNQDYATMIRCKKLSDLEKGKYEDVYENFIGGGTPYYINFFDDSYYLTEHRLPGHSIWQFTVSGTDINATTIY